MNSYGVILELAGRGDAGRFVYFDNFAVVILLRLTSNSLCAGAQPNIAWRFRCSSSLSVPTCLKTYNPRQDITPLARRSVVVVHVGEGFPKKR